jgi:voltage-gated potassium channel
MAALQPIKERLFQIVEIPEEGDTLSRNFDIFFLGLIFLNIITMALETVSSLQARYAVLFAWIETVSVAFFLVEYLVRIWVCPCHPRYPHAVKGRIKFIFHPLMIVDFLAIAPSLLPMFFVIDLRFLRIMRFFRIFRMIKIGRYARSFRILVQAVQNKKEELLISLFMGFVLLLMASYLIYFFETDAQPDKFPNIPSAMWWGVITLTTVGYGDVYPITVAGKIIGALIAVMGIGMFALPAGILASGLIERIPKKSSRSTCPHCGKPLQ